MMVAFDSHCPFCGKALMARTKENPCEFILKVRVIKFLIAGGPLRAKCKHCGRFVTIPKLRSIK